MKYAAQLTRGRPRRTLKSAVLSLTLLAAVPGGTLWAPPAVGQTSAADQEFLFAYRLMQRGDLAEAGEAFDTFLEKFPADQQRGDALYFRAALYRQGGALQAARELLAGASGPSTPQRVPAYAVQLLQGQVLTELGQFDEALQSLEKLDTSSLPAQAVASVQLLKARAYRGAGNYEAASTAAEAAAATANPMQAAALLELARNQTLRQQPELALVTLTKALALEDATVSPEAARLAGDVAFAAGKLDQAGEFYGRVIERFSTSPEFGPAVVGRMWADLQSQRNVAVINANKQFSEGLTDEPKATASYLAASAYQALDQHAAAVTLLTDFTALEGGAERPLQPVALYKLAVSQFQLSRFDDMRRTVERLEKDFPKSPQQVDASFMLATAAAKSGDAAQGLAQLKPFIDAGPDHPYYAQSLLQRAAIYEQSGEPQSAADDLARYLETTDEPLASRARVTLRHIDLLHRLGQNPAAVASAEALIAQLQKPAADTPELDPALLQETLYRLGEAQTRAGEFSEALATFEKLQRDHPLNAYRQAVDLRRGLLLSKLGREDESMKVLIAASDDTRQALPQRIAALRIIAAQLRDNQREDDTAVTLRRIESLGGLTALDDHEMLWLANYEVQRQQPRAALDLLSVFSTTGRKATGGQEAELLYTRGRAHYQLGELDDAYKSFFGVVALGRGYDLEARLLLARTLMRQGKLDEAITELSDLTKVDDSTTVAQALFTSGQAYRQRAELARRQGRDEGFQADLASARAQLKRMVLLYLTVDAIAPLPARGLVELAEIADMLGDPAGAARELQEVVRAFPDSSWADYAKAVLAQKQRNRPDDALAILKRLNVGALDEPLAAKVQSKTAELEAMR